MQGKAWSVEKHPAKVGVLAGSLPSVPASAEYSSTPPTLPDFAAQDKNTAPIILLVLLFGGIVLPLGLAAWYLTRSNK